jgi:hypothetical protein
MIALREVQEIDGHHDAPLAKGCLEDGTVLRGLNANDAQGLHLRAAEEDDHHRLEEVALG